jgi:hypothetical protein
MRRISLKALLAPAALAALILALAPAAPAFANATITIVNGNGPGVGFNDPTLVAPVGGNAGTTLGQQRLIAFQAAADIWGATLDSNVPITILSTFEALNCNATQAVLGSAGTIFIYANFPAVAPYPGPQFAQTWHSQALTNKRGGQQVNPSRSASAARTSAKTARTTPSAPAASAPTPTSAPGSTSTSATWAV